MARPRINKVAGAGTTKRKFLLTRTNPDVVAPPVGPYTHLAIVPPGAELFVLAGQVGVRRDGTLPADAETQFRLALMNARLILENEGLGQEHVIKVNIWLVEPIERTRFLDAWREFHCGSPPPTTVAYVAGLVRPEHLAEVEVWAAKSPTQ